LKQHTVDDEKVNKLNEDATHLIKKTELEIKILKIAIFDEKFLKFEKNKERLNKSIFGVTKIESMNSLLTRDQMKILFSLCEFAVNQKWNLIYRASRDGFAASSFHSKCDDKPNTFSIIKTTNGNVFGGYTEKSWSGKSYKSDSNSFVFSLINIRNKPLKIKWSKNLSIYCCQVYGPTFGGQVSKKNSRQTSNDIIHLDCNYAASDCSDHSQYSQDETDFEIRNANKTLKKNKIKKNDDRYMSYNMSSKISYGMHGGCIGSDINYNCDAYSDNEKSIFPVEENDFMIADQSNINAKSCSNLGISYIHPNFNYGSDEAKSFLAGSHNFIVSEIEVYTK